MIYKTSQSGFTLVELAIVLMIIGLLIGGILKGQELIQNARITTLINRFKSYDAATLTFMDSYGSKPGDIVSPSTRLPNCGTAKCNLGGDGNGLVGTFDEQQAFWLHLKAANLVNGINKDTWVNSGYYTDVAPETPFGGIIAQAHANAPVSAQWPQGLNGHYWRVTKIDSGGWVQGFLPQSIILNIDQKMDNGLPRTGSVLSALGSAAQCIATTYDVNNPALCGFFVESSF